MQFSSCKLHGNQEYALVLRDRGTNFAVFIYQYYDSKQFPNTRDLLPNASNLLIRLGGDALKCLLQNVTSHKSHTGFVRDNPTAQYRSQEPASTDSSDVDKQLDSEAACDSGNSLLGGSGNSPSKNLEQPSPCSSKNNPSNNLPTSKNRRNHGEGNGTIHWRTITKNGKDYPQAYYHWKENGRKKSKYIPKQLLELVQQAEEQKRPVVEILAILGGEILLVGKENSPSKNSPSNVKEQQIPTSKNSPSKTRRHKGLGTGSLQWKTITLNGKDYPQPWYHYEVWSEGNRITKKSKYIPKRLLSKIQELEAQKASVTEILEVLGEKI
ncbi:hypothetical protein [Scytonema sp. NUACC26]|uniref:hypothetical protein n=1 Tax=Scytonema sp. NUACC26 TaxID=3140176 RepID=UPI0034DB805B